MKHISIALCLCGMILMNTSCDNYDDTYPQEYEKILSLQTTGEQAVDLYKTGEATNYSITVIKSGSQPTLTASAHIGAMDAVNFEKYISERFGLCGNACQLLFVQHGRTRLFFC